MVISVCFGATKLASANIAAKPIAKIDEAMRINRVSVGMEQGS